MTSTGCHDRFPIAPRGSNHFPILALICLWCGKRKTTLFRAGVSWDFLVINMSLVDLKIKFFDALCDANDCELTNNELLPRQSRWSATSDSALRRPRRCPRAAAKRIRGTITIHLRPTRMKRPTSEERSPCYRFRCEIGVSYPTSSVLSPHSHG